MAVRHTVMYQPTLNEISSAIYNPYTSHPPQYNAAAGHPAMPYYPPYSHTIQLRSSPVPDIPPPPPDLTSITPEVASRAMHRLISSELRDTGFDSAQIAAVNRIETEVIACTFYLSTLPRIKIDPTLSLPVVGRLFERAHEYANLSNRAGAIATDLVLACDEFRISPEALRSLRTKRKQSTSFSIHYVIYLILLIHRNQI